MSETNKDNIDEYMKKIDKLLPYSSKIKEEKLAELRTDIQTALEESNNEDISLVFGNPLKVAKNFSKGQHWETERASWGIRFLAWIIDMIIFISSMFIMFFGGLFVILTLSFTAEERNQIFEDLFSGKPVNLGELRLGFLSLEGLILLLLGFILISSIFTFAIAYFFMQEGLYSTTIGKKLFNLIVVDKSGIKITWQQAILRNLTKIAGQFFPFDILIGIYMERQDPKKVQTQRAMDILAGTIVVKKLKN